MVGILVVECMFWVFRLFLGLLEDGAALTGERRK